MERLKRAIEEKGTFLEKDLVKVDSFLNHRIDTELMEEIGQEIADHFKDKGIDKVLTVETGGIAPAYAAAVRLKVPLVFAKKTKPTTMIDPTVCDAYSYTKKQTYQICVEKFVLNPSERILFVDDFLANGEAFKGVESLCKEAGAEIGGAAVCVEKVFQKGHAYITERGYDLLALAPIAQVENGHITWSDEL